MHEVDNSRCKNRGCNKCDCYRKQQEKKEQLILNQGKELVRVKDLCRKQENLLEECAKEIENCYGRDTDLSNKIRTLLYG